MNERQYFKYVTSWMKYETIAFSARMRYLFKMCTGKKDRVAVDETAHYVKKLTVNHLFAVPKLVITQSDIDCQEK
jgi:hypothetical protein